MPRSTPGNTRQQNARSRARLRSAGLCALRGCGAPARGEEDPPEGPPPAYCPTHRLLRALSASRARAASRAAKR